MKKHHKSKGWKNISFSPYGLLPLKDATPAQGDVSFVVTKDNIMLGKRHRPDACALALEGRDNASLFPGVALGIWVYRTFTVVATRIGNKIKAIRYVHGNSLRLGVNSFDGGTNTPQSLKPGDIVTLLVPTGWKRIGHHAPGDSKDKSSKGGSLGLCRKRGVYVDPFHAKQARKETKETILT